MRNLLMASLAVTIIGLAAAQSLAEAAPQGPAAAAEQSANAGAAISMARAVGIIGVCVGTGLCVAGGAYGIARIGSTCVESIARQPEAGGAMFVPMVVAAAMIEGGMLFAIFICGYAVFSKV